MLEGATTLAYSLLYCMIKLQNCLLHCQLLSHFLADPSNADFGSGVSTKSTQQIWDEAQHSHSALEQEMGEKFFF